MFCSKGGSGVHSYNKRLWGYLYIITMAIAFTTRYADFTLGYEIQMLVGAFWIVIALAKLERNRFLFEEDNKKIFLLFLKIYLIPKIVIHVYTIMLMILGRVEWTYFSTNFSVYIPTILSIVSLYLFGVKAYKYSAIALIISWLVSVGVSFLSKGPYIFVYAIKQAYFDSTDNSFFNYLELHDLVLSLGYIVTIYYISREKITKKNIFILLAVLAMMVLGMKRIAVLGVVLAIFFYMFLRMFDTNKQYKICLAFGWVGLFLCFLFIFIMSRGEWFFEVLGKFGIHPMGRNYYFTEIMKYAEFDIGFLGIGRNVITKILNTELSYLRVGGVHSDIIKMYVENGFVMFGIWLWYSLIRVTQLYKKYFSSKVSVIYFVITIYTFTLYLTDNVEIYFICQVISMVIPMAYAIKEKKKASKSKESLNSIKDNELNIQSNI